MNQKESKSIDKKARWLQEDEAEKWVQEIVAEKWLQEHDPNYYNTKAKNNEEYKYLTLRQLRRLRENEK